jgi:hypothetical protein
MRDGAQETTNDLYQSPRRTAEEGLEMHTLEHRLFGASQYQPRDTDNRYTINPYLNLALIYTPKFQSGVCLIVRCLT